MNEIATISHMTNTP